MILAGCKRVIVSLRMTSVAHRRIELAIKLDFQDERIGKLCDSLERLY